MYCTLHNSIFCYKNKICNCMFSFNKQLLLLNKCVHCTWRREMWCWYPVIMGKVTFLVVLNAHHWLLYIVYIITSCSPPTPQPTKSPLSGETVVVFIWKKMKKLRDRTLKESVWGLYIKHHCSEDFLCRVGSLINMHRGRQETVVLTRVAGVALFGWSRSRFFDPALAHTLL